MDPDQLASSEASWSGSTLFSKEEWYLNMFFEPEHGMLDDFIQKYGGVTTMNKEGAVTTNHHVDEKQHGP